MKIWKDKVNIPKLGVCEVRELEDHEAIDGYHPPISCGFVNLYQNGKHKSWCGVNFARKHFVDKQKRKIHILLSQVGYTLIKDGKNPILEKEEIIQIKKKYRITIRKSGAVVSLK